MVKSYHHFEEAYVDHIKVCGSDTGGELLNHVCITWRSEVNSKINIC